MSDMGGLTQPGAEIAGYNYHPSLRWTMPFQSFYPKDCKNGGLQSQEDVSQDPRGSDLDQRSRGKILPKSM